MTTHAHTHELLRRFSQNEDLFFLPTFQVLLKNGNDSHEVWSQNGNQGNKWKRGEVFLGLLKNFQVCKSHTHNHKQQPQKHRI